MVPPGGSLSGTARTMTHPAFEFDLEHHASDSSGAGLSARLVADASGAGDARAVARARGRRGCAAALPGRAAARRGSGLIACPPVGGALRASVCRDPQGVLRESPYGAGAG